MPTYRKRNESAVVTSVLHYLQVLENGGFIAFYNRQQAGCLTFQRGGKYSKIRLGREGVADIWVMLKCRADSSMCNYIASPMVFIECKIDKTKQSMEQLSFEETCRNAKQHYWIIRDCDELHKKFKEIGVL